MPEPPRKKRILITRTCANCSCDSENYCLVIRSWTSNDHRDYICSECIHDFERNGIVSRITGGLYEYRVY